MWKKKSLGQHFLRSESYVRLIADAGPVSADDVVVEIGPGEGVLTQELLSRGVKVIAIEKDNRLIPVLEERFESAIATKQLRIVEDDALTYTPRISGSFKVIANIPYYITGALIRKYLTAAHQPKTMILLVQKEVAQRIAKDKKESLLSLSVKAYGNPKYIHTVPKGAFTPPPKVDSAIIAIESISRKNFATAKEEKRFFELLHAGFGQKRKKLQSNLKKFVTAQEAEVAGITENARAEDVLLVQWLSLL